MNNIDTSQLLTQLRAAAAQAGGTPPQPVEQTQGANFSSLLTQSIDKVNDMQQSSAQLQKAFEVGDPNVRLSDVMIASNKSGLAFQAMMQVRNKVVEAYQEVMRMSV